ncbi:MAG TPA: hypothetical protein VFH95_09075 [Candidatus Kapabacteria bacterium]|nr:hypothetical protein [Candidatus Kapabacteria bacterium]
MKSPFSNSSVDELGPLRELRSPLSVSAIRERVLERSAQPALWGQLRNILAEFVVVGVACAAVFQLAGPVARHGVPLAAYQVANPFIATHVSDGTNGSDRANGKNGVWWKISIVRSSQPGIAKDIPISLVNAAAPSEAPLILHYSPINPPPSSSFLHPSSFYPSVSFLHPSSFSLQPSPVWFASASGGAVFSHLRMMGERGEIGFQDGWKTIAVSYTSGDGSRDLRDEIAHHSGLTAPLVSKEHNQELSLLLGATMPAGPIGLRAMAGPAYLSSSSAYFNPATGTTGAPVSLQGFGATAEVSALYQWNSSFEIGVNGIANYLPRQFTSGLFASLEYRFGP